MAYAVIKTGGKQYRVEEGTTLLVERLTGEEGAKLELEPLLYADGDNTVFGASDLGKVKVEAVVTEHLKGPKIRISTYRPKKRNKRTMGHRSLLSRLEIKKISGPSKAKSSEKKEESDGA